MHADAPRSIPAPRLLLRPLDAADAERIRAIVSEPAVAEWWGRQDDGFPLEDEPSTTRFAIVVDGDVAGLIQYGEEDDPDYRHAWIDVFLDPHFHGRGLGSEAVRALADHLIEDRGHHRVTIDPAVDNAPAVRAYEKAGFKRVGVMRQYGRDPDGVWRDGILLDLLASELE